MAETRAAVLNPKQSASEHTFTNDLGERLARLEAIVTHERRIDLVLNGSMPLFMYMDDLAYRQIPDEYKCAVQREAPGVFLRRRQPPRGSVFAGTPMGRSLDYLLESFDRVAVLDIGCQYGTSAIAFANHLRLAGRSEPVFAFDPGDAGSLAPHNIAMNAEMGAVEFFPKAVSNWSGMTLLYSEIGNTENNRLGNPIDTRGVTMSRPAPVTTVDDFMAERSLDLPTFLKIDTQGFDYEVVDGARALIERQPVVLHVEFTPHAMRARLEPGDFLALLCHNFVVLDDANVGLGPIPEEKIAEAVTRIDAYPSQHTDFICISRKLSGWQQLVSDIVEQGGKGPKSA